MGVTEELADSLARDTIAAMDKLADEDLVSKVAKQLGATSTTLEEAFMTSMRVRLAEKRAREFLKEQLSQQLRASSNQ